MDSVKQDKSGSSFTLRLTFGVVLILFLISSALALWDHQHVINMTKEGAIRQAQGLVYQVERELQDAAFGESTLRSRLEDHLFAVGWLIEDRVSKSGTANLSYTDLAVDAGVQHIDLFNMSGRHLAGTSPESPFADTVINDVAVIIGSGVDEYPLGFQLDRDGERHFCVAIGRENGGFILISSNAAELLAWREHAGLGALIRHLQQHPGVDYALLTLDDQILAATDSLPTWIGSEDDPFFVAAQTAAEFEAFFARVDGRNHFEAFTPLEGLGGVVLRIGLSTDILDEIRERSVVAVALRTALFLVIGVLMLAFFVTRQHRTALALEAERIRREVERLEAERAARERQEAMGRLAGGVAHEIRNPLNTVQMVAQRLAAEFEVSSEREEFQSLVHVMGEETARIGRIVEEFLEFARPPKANKNVGNLRETVQLSLDAFKPSCEGKGVELIATLDELKSFSYDADQISQALNNLLRNALEAVETENGRIDVRLSASAGSAILEVEDNGPGIPEDQRARIFHLYYTTKAEGTGVGLPLVYRIADEHGGTIVVKDGSNGGAILTMTLSMEMS